MATELFINGVDGSDGKYLLPPLSPHLVATIAQGEVVDDGHLTELKQRWRSISEAHFAPTEGVDRKKLEETGWGVLFAHDADPTIQDALGELLAHRRAQSTVAHEHYYRAYTGPDGYRPGESKQQFLARHGAGPGPADPDKVPYYLLIVGDPESIPYRFQYQLDVQYAVGRIHFDTPAEYAQYARSVVAAETGEVSLPRHATFFGVRNPDDPATALSTDHLIKPLSREMAGVRGDWELRTLLDEDATKANLGRLLGGAETPAFLFAASHGVGFPNGDDRQLPHQGALLCRDWPGPRARRESIPDDFYFSGDDVADDARLLGLMAFCFACYGAGTPRLDEFAHRALGERTEIAPHAFMARLPQRLLGHPRGGALAVVGHVERAWGCSFVWERAGEQLGVFQSALTRLLDGHPIGSAIEYFNERYAELSSDLSSELEELKYGREADDVLLSGLWTANNDARSYVIIGDPAVRLPVGDGPSRRPTLDGRVEIARKEGEPVQTHVDEAEDALHGGEGDDADLPFSIELITATERRHQETAEIEMRSFGAPGDVAPARANSPDAVARRLRRIGLPEEHARRIAGATDATRGGTRGGTGGGPSFAILSETIPDDLPPETAIGLERILGRNELISVTFLELGAARARSVARVAVRRPRKALSYGTGFLVWPRMLMTNHHVLEDEAAARGSRAEFDYQEDPLGARMTPVVFELDPGAFFVTSAELDFTLVAVRDTCLDGVRALSEFGCLRLDAEPGEILTGEYVNIIQHPNGEPKQLALRENQVTGMPEDRFLHYKTDTAPGSSGSPVFNDQWEVVALHHSGVPRREGERADGRILTVDERIWTRDMGEHRIDWIANEGVRVAAIGAALESEQLDGDQSRLRDQILDPPADADLLPVTVRAPVMDAGASVDRSSLGPIERTVTDQGRTLRLNIPLQVTVQIEPPSSGPLSPSRRGDDRDGDDPIDDEAPIEDEAVSVDPDYSNRRGYDADFLGRGPRRVPLPALSEALAKKAAVNQQARGRDKHVLPYHHYSVVMNRKRKLAFFAAVNIDGRDKPPVKRDRDRWYFDPRINRNEQAGSEVYKRNPLDKGHLVRRLDAAWGATEAEVRVGSDDTFHWTNCSPQHAEFNRNRTTWAGLENYILKNTELEDLKVTVFNGPIFDESDPPYRGVNLPREFWKVVVMVKKDRTLSATGYLLSQESLIHGIEEAFTFGAYKTFQVPIARIAARTGLDFHTLSEHDPIADDASVALESTTLREVTSFDELVL